MIRSLQRSVLTTLRRAPAQAHRHGGVIPGGSHHIRPFSTRIAQQEVGRGGSSSDDADKTRQQQLLRQEQQQEELDRALSSRANNQQNKTTTAQNIRGADRLLVVGSGVAGCAAALVAAETYQIPVTLLFAGNVPEDCNSFWAQGGIIYRNYDPASGDSAASLAQDIHRAGAGLCVDDAVQKVSDEGPDRVRQLLLDESLKKVFAHVPFDTRDDGSLSLCLGTVVNVFDEMG